MAPHSRYGIATYMKWFLRSDLHHEAPEVLFHLHVEFLYRELERRKLVWHIKHAILVFYKLIYMKMFSCSSIKFVKEPLWRESKFTVFDLNHI